LQRDNTIAAKHTVANGFICLTKTASEALQAVGSARPKSRAPRSRW